MFSTKYKSKIFSDIIGHDKIIGEMKERSKTLNFPEVMYLVGEAGSGKTSISTLVSKLLNCKNPVEKRNGEKEPCNECESCRDINEEHFKRDILMFNASTLGKDGVHEIDKDADFFPMFDKNKIIIIDEAHLITASGREAAKKLLEKERKNTYFILCTTESSAFKDTAMKRRGQFYSFKKVDSIKIAEYLFKVINEEKTEVPDDFIKRGIFVIAENSDGSPGYALSLLERCLMGKIYDEREIISELGIVSDAVSYNILEKILKKDKSVFFDLSSIDIKEFFYKSMKILQDAYCFKEFSYIDQEWKIKSADRIKNFDIMELLNLLYNVSTETYFKESSFYFWLFNYFGKKVESKRIPIRGE